MNYQIEPLDDKAMESVRRWQDQLTKPRGSLGRLEDLSIQVAGITANPRPTIIDKVALVMAADHGVVVEGVSAYPQDVTSQMVTNFLSGGAAINVLAKHVGARVVVVDMGVAVELPDHLKLIKHKIGRGTHNIADKQAMSRDQALAALNAGEKIVVREIDKGMDILATGDMGIGNTTSSAAIAAVLTGRPVKDITGRGTGIDDLGFKRKVRVIDMALKVNKPDPADGLDVLAKVGGYEIGGIAGAILGAAENRRPIVIDGFISTAAAMIAAAIHPGVRDYLIAGHLSPENGHKLMLEWLHLDPLLDLNMRLGEGTGAVMAISLVEAACRILTGMATFDQAGVTQIDSTT